MSVIQRLLNYTIFQAELIILCVSCRFLACCARWIGEGPHLELLEILLGLGFDATVIDSPHSQDWPEPASPNWIAEGLAPDPFFVEYQGMLLGDNQGKLYSFTFRRQQSYTYHLSQGLLTIPLFMRPYYLAHLSRSISGSPAPKKTKEISWVRRPFTSQFLILDT